MKTKHILLAEDDANISEVMTIILQDEGYTVRTATTSQELDASLGQQLPDLVFLDVRLGGENGEDIAQKLKSDTKTSKIPVILVSADDKIKEIALRAKADDYLPKPFDMQALIAIVKKHLL